MGAGQEANADGNQHDAMAPPPTTTPHQSSSPSSLESSEDVARRGESGRTGASLLPGVGLSHHGYGYDHVEKKERGKDENNDTGEQDRKGSVGVIVGRLDLCSAHPRILPLSLTLAI